MYKSISFIEQTHQKNDELGDFLIVFDRLYKRLIKKLSSSQDLHEPTKRENRDISLCDEKCYK